MIKNAIFSVSIISTMFLAGCDNTAKVPESTSQQIEQSNTITIGFSDYPGWVAWQIAIEKGWLKEAGVNVDFKWFDYSASLNAFAAKQIDAVTVTNGDNLVVSSQGTKGLIVLATSYSDGNDAIIAKSDIKTLQDLQGKTVALEKGLVSHLLLNTALTDAGIPLESVKISNALTNELPQVFTASDISAVAAWQPVVNYALKAVPASKVIYSSAEKPGLIFDTVSVNAEHLMQNKAQWEKIIQVWGKVVNYINNPETHEDAVRIMAKRVNISPEEYESFMKGTHFLNLQENKMAFKKQDDLKSIYGSTYNVNRFNMEFGVYDKKMDVDSLIYPNLVENAK